MKNSIIYILFVSLITGCTKEMNREITIEGYLMSSCNTPATNKSGYFHYSSGMNWERWAEFTSDDYGYFKVTKPLKGSSMTLKVSGNDVLRNVAPLGKDHLDLGKVYISPPRISYYLHIKVNNAYSELDTLHYRNAGYPYNGKEPWLKKAGPFSDGIIDTVPIASNLGALPITYQGNNVPTIRIDYYVNKYDSWNDKFVRIPTPHCVEEYQDVILEID